MYELTILGNKVCLVADSLGGSIESGLPRETCPSCGQADCVNECDGAQGADENNTESEEDAIGRQRYNAAVDALESILLAHACAGIKVDEPAYVAGLETALDAFSNNF